MADEKLTDRDNIATISNDDLFHIVDVSDATDSILGTSKQGLWSLIKSTLSTYFNDLFITKDSNQLVGLIGDKTWDGSHIFNKNIESLSVNSRKIENIDKATTNVTDNKMVVLGFDSLTDGANGFSFQDTFNDVYRGGFQGEASLGFAHIDNGTAADLGIGFSKSAGLGYMADELDFSIDPVKYSLSGKGVFATSAVAESFSYNANKHFTKARIYYLQRTDGGSFKYGFSNIAEGSRPTQSMVGTLSVQYVEVERTIDDTVIIIANEITGKVAFFAIWYFNSDDYNNVNITSIAKGGMTLSQQLDLDSTYRQYWFSELIPATILLNGGTNDRLTDNKATFKANLGAYIDDIQTGSPETKVIIVEPNQTSDYVSSNADDYTDARTELASEKSVDLLDIPKRIGDYAYFVANSLMLDAIHPNAEGFRLIAETQLDFLGLNSYGNYKEVLPDQYSGGGANNISYNELDIIPFSQSTLTNAVEYTAYELGFINGYIGFYFDLDVYIRLTASGRMRLKNLKFQIDGTNVIGDSGIDAEFNFTDIYESELSGTIPDVSFSLSIISNHAVLKFTPTNDLSSINIVGKIILSKEVVTGGTVVYYY